jgi:hypothetical protein
MCACVCVYLCEQHATPESAFVLYTTLYPAALVAVSTAIVLANLGHVQWLGAAGAVTSVSIRVLVVSMEVIRNMISRYRLVMYL